MPSKNLSMKKNLNDDLIKAYQKRFHRLPNAIISAPGRINLIGEHTDYSGGFVLPFAIDLRIFIAFGKRNDKQVELVSLDFDDEISFNLDCMDIHRENWKTYLTAIAMVMREDGYNLNGWQGVISGTIPIGAGLSSSAALEVACILAFCQASDLNLSPKIIALLGQKAETNWVGIKVGIMDQLISAAGKADHAMFLDCESLNWEHTRIPSNVSVFVLDTMTRRNLSNSKYNARHEELQKAHQIIGFPQFRSITLDTIKHLREVGSLSLVLYNRAKHVITENKRVIEFSQAMQQEDLVSMGRLIIQSHQSLRDDFEVSSTELDLIVELAQNQPNCLGARMTGAGFGGCALALLENKNFEEFITKVSQRYQQKTNYLPQIYKVYPSDGGKITMI